MKKTIRFSWVYALVGVALSSILFSFVPLTGAHSVQVYLDSKLVIDQYIHSNMDAPKLILDPSEKNSQLIVKYNECGRTVTGRMISLKDENNKVLKDWHYEGAATGFKEPMSCLVKDIMALKPKESTTLKLYYSSKEFPQGQQIAYVVIGNKTTTASK